MGKRVVVVGACVAAAAGCGTYSFVRPADTLREGKTELAVGVAVSALSQVDPIIHAAYGITDDIEVIGQNEIWNSFLEGRYGILHERDDGLSLAVGAGGGYAVTLVSALGNEEEDGGDSGAAGEVSVSIGKRLGPVDLTLANRTFVQLDGGFLMSSTRLASRFSIGRHFGLMLEVGGTAHAPVEDLDLSIFIPEASTGFWVGF